LSYLIDTNVLSELRRKSPDPGVVAWFDRHPPASVYLIVLSAAGRPLPTADSLLAATALHYGLILVTRNVKDFAGLPVQLFDLWSDQT
jgi:predicted nucleic acid-binding protein